MIIPQVLWALSVYLALAGKVLYCAVCRKVELTVGVTKPHALMSVTDVGLHKNTELQVFLSKENQQTLSFPTGNRLDLNSEIECAILLLYVIELT